MRWHLPRPPLAIRLPTHAGVRNALGEAEALSRAIFENTAVGIAITDLQGRFQSCNAAYLNMLGYTEDELRALDFSRLIHPADREVCLMQISRILARHAPSFEIVNRSLTKDGNPLWVHEHVSLLQDAAGEPTGIIALVTDMTGRKRSEEHSRENEERLRLSNEAAGIGTFTVDLQTNCAFYSPKAAEILGFPGLQTATVEAALLRVHRDDVAWVRKQYEAATSGTTSGELKMDFRFVRPGGEVRWMTWLGRTEFSEEPSGRRPSRILGCCLDITERKRQEDQIRLLLAEVNHRSKNLLTLVQAVARQTLAANREDFLQRFGKRVEALAASQDLLVKNTWQGADLRELICSQLAHFEDLIGSQIELQGPPLFVSPSAAQALGMAVHELATNAGKYGALANSGGEVKIEWGLERIEGGQEVFIMSWREQGGRGRARGFHNELARTGRPPCCEAGTVWLRLNHHWQSDREHSQCQGQPRLRDHGTDVAASVQGGGGMPAGLSERGNESSRGLHEPTARAATLAERARIGESERRGAGAATAGFISSPRAWRWQRGSEGRKSPAPAPRHSNLPVSRPRH
jgi:PAS domain S-box-containing protein